MAQYRQYSQLSDTSSSIPMSPVMIYINAETDKLKILSDNKGRTGIYQWQHVESGNIYVGSGMDLSARIKSYFSESSLNRNKNMYICNALLHHGHSSFSLTILEYIDISNLSLEKARSLIQERVQF